MVWTAALVASAGVTLVEWLSMVTQESTNASLVSLYAVIYGYESQYWDGLMPRLQMMAEDHTVRGLRFAGGYSMRLSGYSSAYFSGDISGRQTVGDIKREG